VIVLDDQQRIFLMETRDPGDASKPHWWEIPGGGLDPGETSAQGAARECYEETGLEPEMGPVVWTQHAMFEFGGISFDQDEFIHIAWVKAGDDATYAPKHLEFLEAAAFLGSRWWPVDELMASDVPVLPTNLRRFLPDLAAGNLPDEPPHVGDV
jgi:8-oxo-dGTP pyrophosphatase MutT (NUDIX family)